MWIKPSIASNQPSTTTNQPASTSFFTIFKNLFVYCKKKPYVETINKTGRFFFLKELQNKFVIINVIMSYVDFHDNVNMIRASKQSYQVGVKCLLRQYTTLLQQVPTTPQRKDIWMIRDYARFLETLPIPADYLDLEQFDLPKMTQLISGHILFSDIELQDEIQYIKEKVPAIAIFMTDEEFFVEHIFQWKCWENSILQFQYSSGKRKEWHNLTLKPDSITNYEKQLNLKYGKDDNLPYHARFFIPNAFLNAKSFLSGGKYANYAIENGWNKKGYYQNFGREKEILKIGRAKELLADPVYHTVWLFYYPYINNNQ